MSKNKVKELSYYLFFSIMILAKGIGLDSGDKLYYLLSAVACICVGCKIILTKYSKKQLVAMVLLGIIAFAAYRNSGRMGILLTTLTILGMKDIKVRNIFKIGAVIYGISFIGTVMAAGLGIIANPLVVHEKGSLGEVIRWGMGYSTGNVFHESYFILVALLCYTWGKNYNIKRAAGLMLGNLIVFLFSLSYTGIAVTTFYIILNMYAVRRKSLSKVEKYISQLFLPACLLVSFGFPLLLQYPVIQKLDRLMQARLSFSKYFLLNQPITLLGERMRGVPYFWIIMDNGYVYYFMTFGILAFAIFIIGYAILIARYSGISIGKKAKGTDLPALAMIFSFLLYGIMEQFISNAFMNVSLLFMGEVLFNHEKTNIVVKESCRFRDFSINLTKELEKRKKVLGGIVILGGVAGIISYFLLAALPQYVEVPLKSLNQVEAESVIIYIQNEEGTKDSLKEEMELCKAELEENILIQKVLKNTNLDKKLTPEEVTAALEFSLPQSVHSSREYDSFRIRILNLYYDIGKEEYHAILESLLYDGKNKEEVGNLIIGEIYPEQIKKDDGSDRIEHINNEKNYMVQKSGNIVRVEYFRGAILSLIGGIIIAMVLFVIIIVIRYNNTIINNRKEKI